MSATDTLPRPADADVGEDDDHIICRCTPEVAFCGAQVDPRDPIKGFWDGVAAICPLCALAEGEPCPRCGR